VLYANPALYTYPAYTGNFDNMAAAMESVAAVWAGGLVNSQVFDGTVAGNPWADPRYGTATRWGHVSMIGLTDHSFDAAKNFTIQRIAFSPLSMIRGYVDLRIDPAHLVDFERLRIPFYLDANVHVFPVGGVKHSLAHGASVVLFNQRVPWGYSEGVYDYDLDADGNADGKLMWNPNSAGTQTMQSVEFPSGAPAVVRVRSMRACTEITTTDLFGDGVLMYQNRFAPTTDFANETWRAVRTNECLLGAPVWQFP